MATALLTLFLAGAKAATGHGQPVVLDHGPARLVILPQSGSLVLTDLRTGVSWECGSVDRPWASVTLSETGGRSDLPLDRCEVVPEPEGLRLRFQIRPRQGPAGFELRITRLPDGPGFAFRWQADPALPVARLRLFEELRLGQSGEAAAAFVPVRMGLRVPAEGSQPFHARFETYGYEGCHMAMLGTARLGSAALWTWTNPDVTVELQRRLQPGPTNQPGARLTAAFDLGPAAREIRWIPVGRGDHVQIAKAYQNLARNAGWWVPWSQKLRGHPDRTRYLGAANVKLWSLLDRRMDETSTRELAVHVNWTFDQAARVAEHLRHDLHLDRVLFGIGGWIHRGYDNQHPDILPPAPECGGEAAFRDACRRILQLGYLLSPHDNYQDMYRDAPSWDERWLNKNPDGSPTKGGVWAGGQAWIVCSRMALELAARPQNLPAVRNLSGANAYFIDTTFAAGLYECHDPQHPLTREDDLRWKQALSDYARNLFGSFGSEDGREWAVPHADYFEGLAGVGGHPLHNRDLLTRLNAEPVPLFELVYRECIQIYGKYGYDPARAADYVLHHLLLGRPLHYHNLPPGLYWEEDFYERAEPSVAAIQSTGPRAFSIRYAWKIQQPPKHNWRVFVHFCDEQGRILFQNDHDPDPPTRQWTPGTREVGPFNVTIPEGLTGPFSIRIGWYDPATGRRAQLQGPADSERRIRAGRLILRDHHARWEPEPETASADGPDPALFLRADHGWAEGLHPWDRFLKNTQELLGPLNLLTADQPMTEHAFLTPDHQVQRVRFGSDPRRACTVVVNRSTNDFPWLTSAFGPTVLPPGGFVVESDRFIAFHARAWNDITYHQAPFFTLRSLDDRPLTRSRRVRVFHGWGDPSIRIGRTTVRIPREAVVDPQTGRCTQSL